MTALAIKRGGGRPLRITPNRPLDLSRLDAVVIGGGTDVDPLHYDEPRPGSKANDEVPTSSALDWLVSLALMVFRIAFARHSREQYDPARDEMEKRVIGHAIAFDLPILGICRGAQLMNVALGGSLHQDISQFYEEGSGNIRGILPCKTVELSSDSHLQGILGVESTLVNALHRQAVKTLGEDMVVSAVEPSGVVQATEKRNHRFFIGVQWHPEYIPQSSRQQALFRELVRNAHPRRAG